MLMETNTNRKIGKGFILIKTMLLASLTNKLPNFIGFTQNLNSRSYNSPKVSIPG